MGKIIFWIVVFFGVLLALRLVSVHQTRRDERHRRDSDGGKGKRDTKPAQEVMVKCGRCGVFLPKSNAVMTPQGLSCGDEACGHRR